MHPTHLNFWGKARSEQSDGPRYHPVAYHLLDVAATADALLCQRPLLLLRGATLLNLDPATARPLLVALVAFHDIGKFTPAFQAKSRDHWPAELGPITAYDGRAGTHMSDGYTMWNRRLSERYAARLWPKGGNALGALTSAVFGHHGKPVTPYAGRAERIAGTAALEPATMCADALMSLLMPAPVDAKDLSLPQAQIASWWVAGLTNLADWVGSSQHHFPYAFPIDGDSSLAQYWELCRARAERAVATEGLAAPIIAPERPARTIVGKEALTPTQAWAEKVDLPSVPTLLVIEDVTGSGKTEAAQILVHRLMAKGMASGAYWAMPTQATANAMYGRQSKAMRLLFELGSERRPSLVLAHGQQWLHDDFRKTVLPGIRGDADMRREMSGADQRSEVACTQFHPRFNESLVKALTCSPRARG